MNRFTSSAQKKPLHRLACRGAQWQQQFIRLALAVSMLAAGGVQAQPATFVDNVLAIPKATVGETIYSLEFGLTVNGSHYDFPLLAAAELTDTNTDGASAFDGAVLRVPTVDVGGINYSLELSLLSASPVVFRLQSFAEVASAAPSDLEQATTLFGASIETQVVQQRCIACHVSGGIAANSGLLFARGEGSASANLSAFESYVNGATSQRTRVLSMVRGIGHTGGQQLSEGSDAYSDLSDFLQLLLDHAASN